MYCSELIESQGSYSLKAFLDRIEVEGGKSHQTLLNDPKIKEIRTLVNRLTTQHPKLMYITDHLRTRYQIAKSDYDTELTRNYRSQKQEQLQVRGPQFRRDAVLLADDDRFDLDGHVSADDARHGGTDAARHWRQLSLTGSPPSRG